MKKHITQAISEHRPLRLIYETRRRLTVEPQRLGLTPEGHEVMLCWQVVPPLSDGNGWRMLLLDKISALQVLDQSFELSPGDRPLPPHEFFFVTAITEVDKDDD